MCRAHVVHDTHIIPVEDLEHGLKEVVEFKWEMIRSEKKETLVRGGTGIKGVFVFYLVTDSPSAACVFASWFRPPRITKCNHLEEFRSTSLCRIV